MASRTATSFESAAAFRAWLEKNHASATELLLCCRKTGSGRAGVTYREALDEALCFGWIDGVRRALDADTFTQRFSPRKRTSAWSKVNIKRFGELKKAGRIRPAGLAAYARRRPAAYSFESRPAHLTRAHERAMRSDAAAWEFWQRQAPWYRRTCAFFVMSAKKAETRERRFERLRSACAHGRPISPLLQAKLKANK